MLRIFAIDNCILDDDALFEKWLARCDGLHSERAKTAPCRAAANRAVASGVILPLALRKCGIYGGVRCVSGEFGKPRLADNEAYFNVSHSGDYTVIAVSDGEVGVDLQLVGKANTRIADRFFTDDEKKWLKAQADRQLSFCRLWAAKESFLKAVGTGLARPLDSVEIDLCEGVASDRADGSVRYIAECAAPGGYVLAVCCLQPQPVPAIEYLSL